MKYSATKFYKIVERNLIPLQAEAIENAEDCLEDEQYIRGLREGFDRSMLIVKTLHMNFSLEEDDWLYEQKSDSE